MPAYKDTKTNTWYVQFYYVDWTGQRKHKVKRGFQRKKDAENYEHSFKSTDHPSEITIGALAEAFIKSMKSKVALGTIKISTYDSKEYYIRHYILPYFTDTVASKVKVKDIEEWLQVISAWPESPKEKRSSNTVNTARQILGQLFKFGMKNYSLASNPTTLSERMRYHSNDTRAKYWTLEQFLTFIEYISYEHYRVLFSLIFYSGLRLGEALALTPDDIGPDYITVNKTWVELHNGNKLIGTPKTETSTRDVVIPEHIASILHGYMDMLVDLRPTDRIFPFGEQRVRAYMSSVVARAGLPKLSPHGLRHSYSSILFSTCKNINVVSKQLGHANPEITQRIYSHMLPDEDVQAVKKFNELIAENVENLDINSI